MQRALLSELQRHRDFPCVTVLANTTPGGWIDQTQRLHLERLIESADRRLRNDVDDSVRRGVVGTLWMLLAEAETTIGTEAVALCASPSYSAAVKLGRKVVERFAVDDSFATGDLVADRHRTATFRVVTVSEHMVRMLYGDERRLAEQVDAHWPLVREEGQSIASWTRAVVHALRAEQRRHAVPTVVAGVERSVNRAVGPAELDTIGLVAGNHDRTGWAELHLAAWPLVERWVEAQQMAVLERLDAARSQRRFAGGLDEVSALADDGRLELLVVEDGLEVAEVIESVLRYGGTAVVVDDGRLQYHERIAAVARY